MSVTQPRKTSVCEIYKFVERDIDLLLAEELRVDAEFAEWMLAHFNAGKEILYPAIDTNVSVVEDGSEADVVATFLTRDGGKHRLFIENKIDAVLMPEQLERYVRRAEGEVRRGAIRGFSIVFFTPAAYAPSHLPDGVRQITFEDASSFFRSKPACLRSEYKASFLSRALPLRTPASRDASVAETDPYIAAWWDTVYAMLDREFPGFFLHRTRYPRSVYFAPSTPGQASYLRVDFKGHKGEVDLAFKDVSAASLNEVLAALPTAPGKVVANGRSSAIQISGLPSFVISDGLAVIETKVLAAYRATHLLLRFWWENQATFDRLTERRPL